MKINFLTIGTRGDVQPFIALGKGLKDAGYEVTLTSLRQFKSLAEEYGLNYFSIRGDYLELTPEKENKFNPLERIRKYKKMAWDTLIDEWESIKNADILIYNPAALGGHSIAEKLKIPSFAAFPTPMYTPTKEFPCPFFPFKNLGIFNKISHSLFMKIGPSIYKSLINNWRKAVLDLPPAKNDLIINGKPVIRLYCYSKEIVPVPEELEPQVRL